MTQALSQLTGQGQVQTICLDLFGLPVQDEPHFAHRNLSRVIVVSCHNRAMTKLSSKQSHNDVLNIFLVSWVYFDDIQDCALLDLQGSERLRVAPLPGD